ncbi:MAG: ABC transporter permease [SAR202 cluster bacterium]|jgi:hypothetical protein|nr:ABC transporter permease [SAR202 cluster bacterium]MDP6512588.1 ABC transporter permease [SAR202 cluster bacterium]MDP6714259.1 ABC transporter permease [SAR202 cluster bacterium]|tara:strand:- start:4653 stop:8315 length:3663 start_codon:yes stop_codon:yes gene_type:complete
MNDLSTRRLAVRRLADDWKLPLTILVGIVVATTLISSPPVYLDALEKVGVNNAIDAATDQALDMVVISRVLPLESDKLHNIEESLDRAIEARLAGVARGVNQQMETPPLVVGLPDQPLPEANDEGASVSRGMFHYEAGFFEHVTITVGGKAEDTVAEGPEGPILDAVIGAQSAQMFGLSVGEVAKVTPALGEPVIVSARIVGIVEPADLSDDYWRNDSDSLFAPRPLPPTRIDAAVLDPEEPPLLLFISRGALVDGVGNAYPSTLVEAEWVISVDKEGLKRWSVTESRQKIDDFELDIGKFIPASELRTGIKALVNDLSRSGVLSSITLVLLFTVMAATLLYFLVMVASHLAITREGSGELLMSRGAGIFQVFRLHAIEGLVLTVIPVVAAPFLAMGAVAFAGMLPYFRSITSGGVLPVGFNGTSFLLAGVGGLLSLIIFVVPAVMGARAGLIAQRLRSSRPPLAPVFQRFYLDIGLLIVGGMIFWEFRARGQLVSEGLFGETQVNEAALLAPVLFLFAVALLFLRFFPQVVRYFSGESQALLRPLALATAVWLGVSVGVSRVQDGEGSAWIGTLVLLGAVLAVFRATEQARTAIPWLVGLGVQSSLVAGVMLAEPLDFDELILIPQIALISLPPAQLLYLAFQRGVQRAPVWVSMSLWHMARNPLQYGWLILLLVLVSGLGVLSNTVGGTLDRSNQERILYNTAADFRLSDIPARIARTRSTLKASYLDIPGVTTVSMARRGEGNFGAAQEGSQFQVLALEPQEFSGLSWFRDDFSAQRLDGLMRIIDGVEKIDPLLIPEGATSISVWAKPEGVYPIMSLWMVVQDATGRNKVVTLGKMGPLRWHQMSAELPDDLELPLSLVSVQVYEPVTGSTGSAGGVLLDDIQVSFGPGQQPATVEDFDEDMRWTVLATSNLGADMLEIESEDARGGSALSFSFGTDTNQGVRGFYQSPTAGPLSMVATPLLLQASGLEIGSPFIANIMGVPVPVVVGALAEHFPTMDPNGLGFGIVDLDSLLAYMNVVTGSSGVAPNEIFISHDPSAHKSTQNSILTSLNPADRVVVLDRESQLASVRLDPFITAGWRAMKGLSLGIVVFTAGLGYITYLLTVAHKSQSEMGVLRSLGLSHRQMIGLWGIEHLVILFTGVSLGTWAGFQMSNLMVSSVTVTESGQSAVPPVLLTTDWGLMIAVYVVLAAIVSFALFRLNRHMQRLDIQTLSRISG